MRCLLSYHRNRERWKYILFTKAEKIGRKSLHHGWFENLCNTVGAVRLLITSAAVLCHRTDLESSQTDTAPWPDDIQVI